MTRSTLLSPVLLLALGACVTSAQASASKDSVAIGERVYVDGPYVTPVSLIEDSRCPINARCVWEGRLRISARIETGKGSERRMLTLGKPIPVADGTLELISARPAPLAGKTTSLDEYRFGFVFEGGY